jgi:hypothetical protein
MINEDSMSRISMQIKEQMKKAFFDLIDQNVNSEKPDYDWITNLYEELLNRLASFLKKNSSNYKLLQDEFDVELFRQMISNDVFDQDSMLKLINNTFSWIQKLQAPARDEETNNAKNRVLSSEPSKIISTFLKEIHICIDNIETDIDSFYKNLDH